MLEQSKIDEYTRLLKECEKAKQVAQNLTTEINMLKKQGIEKLKEKGYNSLADASKIDEEIQRIEQEIEKQIPEMKSYVETVNEKREEKEKILMG